MKQLAPGWHLGALAFVIAAVATTGSLLARYQDAPTVAIAPPAWPVAYATAIAVDWALVVYVARVGRGRWRLSELLGARGPSRGVAALATDILLAGAAWLLIEAAELASVHFAGARPGVAQLLPATDAARIAWCAFALTAGFCEEVVYRGYLQTEVGARTRSPLIGVVAQALLFGLAHADQGGGAALRIGAYGLLLGVLASARGSLWPGILCHVCVDLVSGLHSR
jgi:uncharacterized protein